jgi:P4 family phage/plasmid primase-like protien
MNSNGIDQYLDIIGSREVYSIFGGKPEWDEKSKLYRLSRDSLNKSTEWIVKDKLVDVINEYHKKGWSVWISLADKDTGDDTIEGVKSVSVFWFDFDAPRINKALPATEEEREKAFGDATKFKSWMLTTFDVVGFLACSGNGYHLFYPIDAYLLHGKHFRKEINEKQRLFFKKLREESNSNFDKVTDIRRITQPIGVPNQKIPHTPVNTFWVDSPSDEEMKYARERNLKILTGVLNTEITTKNPVAGTQMDHPKFTELIKHDTKLRELYAGDWKKHEFPSRSEAEQSIVTVLSMSHFNGDEIKEIMNGCKIGKWQEKGESYQDISIKNGQIFKEDHLKENTPNPPSHTITADVFFLDERGRRCINYETLLNVLLEKHTFKTLSDTEQVLVYEKGIYTDATVLIKGFVEDMLGTDATSYIVREQIGHVQRRFYTDREQFNADKEHIPVKNGLLNLKTFQLEPFNPEMMYMFKLPGKFDESASYEATERFFAEVVHEEDIPILQEFFGYCLIADLPAHKMMWLIGEGRNGKSTTGNLLKAIIGEQNTSAVQLNELDGEHRFSYVEMFGKLLNLVPEPPTRFGLQTPLIKAATGGDTIRGEIKGVQKPINFKNFAKFMIYANEIPRIFDTSLAFWKRTIAIHFPNQFVEEHETKDIYKEILKFDGLSGLLNWAIAGLKRLQANNYEFTTSKWQDETKKKMERSSQPVETFIDERCTIEDVNAWISKDDLYLAYQEYCAVFKLRVMDYDALTRSLRRAAPIAAERVSIEGVRTQIWKGISLKKQTDNLDTLDISPARDGIQTIVPISPKTDMVNRGLNEERSKDSHIRKTKGGSYGLPTHPGSSKNRDTDQNPQQAQCELCGKTTLLTAITSGGISIMACKECVEGLNEKDNIKQKKQLQKTSPKTDMFSTHTLPDTNDDMLLTDMDPRANDEKFQNKQSKEAKKNMEETISETPRKNVSVMEIMHTIEAKLGSDMPIC